MTDTPAFFVDLDRRDTISEFDFSYPDDDSFGMLYPKSCPVCGDKDEGILVRASDLHRWLDGEPIQNVWPRFLDYPEQSETFISGTCEGCWDYLGRNEEEDYLTWEPGDEW